MQKYKIGHVFYKMFDDKIVEFKVTNIHISEKEIRYSVQSDSCQGGSFTEDDMNLNLSLYYSTAEEAIKNKSAKVLKILISDVNLLKESLLISEKKLSDYKEFVGKLLSEAKKLNKKTKTR